MDGQNQPTNNEVDKTPTNTEDSTNGLPSGDTSKPAIVDSLPSETTSKPSLATPITENKVHANKAALIPILLSVFSFVVFVAAVYGVYAWQHQSVVQLNQKISSDGNEISTLNVAAAKSKVTVTVTTPSAQAKVNIPALNISLSVPNILADITQSANSQGTLVNLSTQTLTDLDVRCTANSLTSKALGNLVKNTGTFPKGSSTMTLVKQTPSYYIAYTAPLGVCSSISQVNTLNNSLITALKTSFSSVSVIQ